MKKNKWLIIILGSILFSLFLAGCSSNSKKDSMAGMDMGENDNGGKSEVNQTSSEPFQVLKGNEFTLTAKESELQINGNIKKNVWTYNGTVPGPQLRVKQGEKVKVTLKNELKVPVTIHWHGLPVPNNMDGVPGVTMNAVKPGESFVYEFPVNVPPGTYWYHSHQNGVVQLDKGLYGSLVVEDAKKKTKTVDRDYTVVVDEWMKGDPANADNQSMSGMNMGKSDNNSMPGMDMGNSDNNSNSSMGNNDSNSSMSEAEMMPLMYPIFTANGKSGSSIKPLIVKKGEKVKIRLVNAGFLSHKLHLQGHRYKIVSSDGQVINNPPSINGQMLNIAPGERYDIEFTADNPGKWLLDEHSTNPGAKDMTIPIVYEGAKGTTKRDKEDLPEIDITQYGEAAKGEFSLSDKYNVEYNMDLNTGMKDGDRVFTINGKTFPETEPINVKKGDLVKVTLKNNSPKDIHPMHLHGHFFQVLSKNGKPVSGSPLVKDTLNILPGEEYVVAFKADNPGDWMFHCHDLGHASAGMVTMVKYNGFKPDFVVDPTAKNNPE